MKKDQPRREMHPPARNSVRVRLGFAAALPALLMSACGDAGPAALTVGPVSYSQNQLLGLADSRRQRLAELTAFALAVSDSSTDALGAPLVAEWEADRLLEILGAELTLERNGIGDDVLEAQYLTNPEWELVVRHILFFSERWRSSEHRTEAEAKAERAMEALRAGADFATTAAELSEEPGAEGRQGLLAPGREGSWVPEFWTAALALQPGEISAVTETQYGFHILRLEDREVVPFTEARSVIVRSVADQLDDPAAVLSSWMAAHGGAHTSEGRSAALSEASLRGLTVPSGEHVELIRTWDDIAYRFSATFGFRYGWGVEQIAVGALAALSNPAQNANLSRTELSTYRSLIEARYTIDMVPGL